MRHGKAEPFAATDRERRLTERGREQATDAGAFLSRIDTVPDYAVVSDTVRTQETWAALAAAANSAADPTFESSLASAGSDQVLELLHRVPADVERLIVVGHNPAMSYLAHLLDNGRGHQESVNQMLQGYPEAALTVFEVAVPWVELGPETGQVVDFHVGRG